MEPTCVDSDTLLLASLQGDVWRVRQLVASGANVNFLLRDRLEQGHGRRHFEPGSSSLHLVAGGCSHYEEETERADAAAGGASGAGSPEAIEWARRMRRRVEVARLLVSNGSDASARTPVSGETPLHLASRLHRLDIVRVLLSAGVAPHVDALNAAGLTPLAVACGTDFFTSGPVRRFRADTLRALLAAGADPNGVRVSCLAAAVGAAARQPASRSVAPPAFAASDAAEIVELLFRCGYRLDAEERCALEEQWGPSSPVPAIAQLHSTPEGHPERTAAARIRSLAADPPAASLYWPWTGLADGTRWTPDNHVAFVKVRRNRDLG